MRATGATMPDAVRRVRCRRATAWEPPPRLSPTSCRRTSATVSHLALAMHHWWLMTWFRDRRDAGARLAQALNRYAGGADLAVLALPRGGVPVGYEVATRLVAPLDVIVVRKLGVPGCEELAMGAIASGEIRIVETDVIVGLGISRDVVEQVAARERLELLRRERLLRGDRPVIDLNGRTAIVVDDGVATGSTMAAAIEVARRRGAARIVCAVPVSPPHSCAMLAKRADDFVCLDHRHPLRAVGEAYEDFAATTDAEVRDLLDRARKEVPWSSASTSHPQA